jgi:hypothetical protein
MCENYTDNPPIVKHAHWLWILDEAPGLVRVSIHAVRRWIKEGDLEVAGSDARGKLWAVNWTLEGRVGGPDALDRRSDHPDGQPGGGRWSPASSREATLPNLSDVA